MKHRLLLKILSALSLLVCVAVVITTALIVGCRTSSVDSRNLDFPERPSTTVTVDPASSTLSRDEAAAIARRVADDAGLTNYVMSDGSPLSRGNGWIFHGFWPEDPSVGAHFFIRVYDDGTTRIQGGH